MACNTSEGPGSLPLPPLRVKKRKELRRKKSRQGKQNKTTPPPSSRSETATEYAYKHYFFMASNSSSMIKQLLKLNWLSQNVVFVSVWHIIMETIIMHNYLRTWKIIQYSLHKSFFYLHDDLSMLFLPCGGWWKRCAELRSSTHIPTLQRLSVLG